MFVICFLLSNHPMSAGAEKLCQECLRFSWSTPVALACLPAIVLSYRETEWSKTSQRDALTSWRIELKVARRSLRSKGWLTFAGR